MEPAWLALCYCSGQTVQTDRLMYKSDRFGVQRLLFNTGAVPRLSGTYIGPCCSVSLVPFFGALLSRLVLTIVNNGGFLVVSRLLRYRDAHSGPEPLELLSQRSRTGTWWANPGRDWSSLQHDAPGRSELSHGLSHR